MKSISILLVILLVLPIVSCDKDKENPVENFDLNFSDAKKASELIETDSKFGIDLFKEVLKMEGVPDNVMISPLSAAIALGMTSNGAKGSTLTAFDETLRMQGYTRDEMNSIYKTLLSYLIHADTAVVLEVANSIWYHEDFPVLESFIKTNRNYYQAEVRDLDFNDPGAKNVINGWVANKTHDKIRDILDQIPTAALMYLINAIYFNGIWTYQFDPEDTYTSTFRKDDLSTVQVKFMSMQQKVAYMSNDTFSAIELDYGNRKFSMCFILPKSGKTITDVINAFNLETFNSLISNLEETEVKIFIPKFKFGYKELLNDPLTNMGLGIAFSCSADFTGINPGGNLFISRVIHQSFVDVNEAGTEAAVATVVEITWGGSSVPFFTANKPFLFLIREKSSNAILFIGKLGLPVYE